MELKEYIATTLEQIVQGVSEASESCKEYGAIINPRVTCGENGEFFIPKHGSNNVARRVQLIKMDINVTVTEATEVEGKLKAGLSVLGAGVNGKTDGSTTSSNHISFEIPICLPIPRMKQDESQVQE